MSDIVARAETTLEGVTPGPWEAWAVDDKRPGDSRVMAGGDGTYLGIMYGRDAEFAAAAPTLVADLLVEVKRLREKLDLHRGDVASLACEVDTAEDARDAAYEAEARMEVERDAALAEIERLLAEVAEVKVLRSSLTRALTALATMAGIPDCTDAFAIYAAVDDRLDAEEAEG